jgi:hypothetical protein
MYVEVIGHPTAVIVSDRAERIKVLATQHVHQKPGCLFDVGDSDADVVESTQPGQGAPQLRHRLDGTAVLATGVTDAHLLSVLMCNEAGPTAHSAMDLSP